MDCQMRGCGRPALHLAGTDQEEQVQATPNLRIALCRDQPIQLLR